MLSIFQAGVDIITCLLCLGVRSPIPSQAKFFIIGSVLVFFLFAPLYAFKNWTFRDEIKSCTRSVLYVWFVAMLFAWPDKHLMLNISICLAVFIPAVGTARYLVRRMLASTGLMSINVLILGAGLAGEIIGSSINASPFTLRKLKGFIDDDPAKNGKVICDAPVMGKLKDLRKIQGDTAIDEVVIAEPEAPRKTIVKLMHKFRNHVRDVYILNTYSDSVRGVNDIQLTSASGGLINPVNRFVKTIMDYTGGVFILLLSLPVMAVIAWKIRHDDGGNVLFRHARAGKDLKPFKVCKFRTMVPGSEQILQNMLKDEKLRKEFKASFKFKNDPRITPFGKTLRHYSLDELPQIFNVLMGEMSLIGPRPIVREEVEKYYGTEVAKHIFHTKPGMTGLWQVSGRNDIEDYDLRIKYDMYYVHNWSVFLDLTILLRTIWVVFNGKGAY